MRISMWIVNDWLAKYSPKASINNGKMTITGVRYIADNLEMNKDYLYIGYADSPSDSDPNNIICLMSLDCIASANSFAMVLRFIDSMV